MNDADKLVATVSTNSNNSVVQTKASARLPLYDVATVDESAAAKDETEEEQPQTVFAAVIAVAAAAEAAAEAAAAAASKAAKTRMQHDLQQYTKGGADGCDEGKTFII